MLSQSYLMYYDILTANWNLKTSHRLVWMFWDLKFDMPQSYVAITSYELMADKMTNHNYYNDVLGCEFDALKLCCYYILWAYGWQNDQPQLLQWCFGMWVWCLKH